MQLKDFLDTHGLLSRHQSGFRKKHSTITAALKVVNDIIEALDCRKYCAALFIDLSKAFDTVDHAILSNCLHQIGLSGQAVKWFSNYLTGRSQCVQSAGVSSSFLPVLKDVPQGSVLGPLMTFVTTCQLLLTISMLMTRSFTAHLPVLYKLLQSAFDGAVVPRLIIADGEDRPAGCSSFRREVAVLPGRQQNVDNVS